MGFVPKLWDGFLLLHDRSAPPMLSAWLFHHMYLPLFVCPKILGTLYRLLTILNISKLDQCFIMLYQIEKGAGIVSNYSWYYSSTIMANNCVQSHGSQRLRLWKSHILKRVSCSIQTHVTLLRSPLWHQLASQRNVTVARQFNQASWWFCIISSSSVCNVTPAKQEKNTFLWCCYCT